LLLVFLLHFVMANVQNNLGKSVPECKTIQDFAAAGDNGGGDDDSENSEIMCRSFLSSSSKITTTCLFTNTAFNRPDSLLSTQPTVSEQ